MCPCTKSMGKPGFYPGPSLVKKPDPRFVYFKYQQLTFKLRDIVSCPTAVFWLPFRGKFLMFPPLI